MQRSLFSKYLKVTMIIVLSSFVVLGTVMMVTFSEYTKNDKRRLLTQSAASAAAVAEATFLQGGTSSPQDAGNIQLLALILQTFSLNIDADIFLADGDGRVILGAYANSELHVGSSFEPPESIPAEAVQRCLADGSYTASGRNNGVYPEAYYVVGVPFNRLGSPASGAGAVFAAMNASSMTEYQFDAFQMFLIAALVAFVVAFVVVGVSAYRLVKPLRLMSSAAKALGKGDFSVRVPVDSADEIGQLALSFNNMANSLASSESMNRSFVANVSHELKTPMTTIAGFIDGILDGTIPADRRDHYLSVVSVEVKRLSRLVQTMLNLSRIDNGELKLHPSDFDLSQTVLSTVLTFEKSVDERRLDIRGLDTLTPHTVHGDEDLLHQVVYNLVENAVKFTNEGGFISFTVSDSIDRVELAIENSGAGIPPDELPLIFEKFYKADKSRSVDKNGMGLGLYLVRTIVKLHGGDITVSSVEGEYTRFSFYIPKPPEVPKLKPSHTVEDAVISERPKREHRAHRDEKPIEKEEGDPHD